ncbi:MAG: hypothetical protein IT294_12185 [Deltaproteobacteria bacterium]|nr:hypothetical protein [Deltaproteobacteria bacterium]
MHVTSLVAIALGLLIAAPLHAADQTILGAQFQAKNPTTPDKRKVQVKAKEKASPNTIVGDPVLNGATLTIRANGTTPSLQVFALPQGLNGKGKPFWTGTAAKGFKYSDSKGENGTPVKKIQLKKSGSGVFQIQAQASGKILPLNVTPPNIGTDACAFLEIGGGDSYSVKFPAGNGVIVNKAAAEYSHKKVTTEGSCTPTCSDGLQNQGESDVDCGGPCAGCPPGGGCTTGADCTSGVCASGVCQAPTCSDGVQNQSETDVDCGGPCAACPPGGGCATGADCTSGVCIGNVCQAPTCSDGVQNQGETAVDCGGPCAPCSCDVLGVCRMFVTSTSSGGNLGGLAGADATCNTRAAAAGLTGVYQAWLCALGASPATRSTHASVNYRRTDGALIANNWIDLTDGAIANAISRDEYGNDVSASAPFLPWTYVNTAGACDNETYLSPGSGPCPAFSNCPTNCANDGGSNGWTSSSGWAQGSKGDINATNGNWTDGATGLCSTPAERIYCIEQ